MNEKINRKNIFFFRISRGEYTVGAVLAKNEINGSLTMGNHKSDYIIATNQNKNKACFIT
jgi:hypothetical protein